MFKLEMEDVDINKVDLKIDIYWFSGVGGQYVNKIEFVVWIIYLFIGIVLESQDGCLQIKNCEIVLNCLYVKIMEVCWQEYELEQAVKWKFFVGLGDWVGKICIYNYL